MASRAAEYPIVSMLALAAALQFAGPAAAQQATPEDAQAASQVDDIVVTANKRAQRLNDVPAAVSAFTAEDRTLRGITTTQDVAKFTPGVSISDSPNRVNVRGVGRVTNALGSDAGVANYVDGFYTSESDVMASSDFFSERIEVLRGPQGTLYGRNSIGGAVNVISKRPTDVFEAEGRAFVNNYMRYGVAASASGPISDTVRFRIAAMNSQQDKGYVENVAGPDQHTDERFTVEGQIEADLTPNLNAWLRLQHTRYDQRPQAQAIISSYDRVPYFGGLVANPTYGLDNVSIGDPTKVAYDFGGRQLLDNNINIATNITLDLPEVIIRYIGGYAQYDYQQTRDFDQTARAGFERPAFGTVVPVPTNYVERIAENKTWTSSEFNFLSQPGGDVDWIFGLYYYHETLEQPVDYQVPDAPMFERPTSLPGVPTIINPRRSYYSQVGDLEATSLAAFGQTTWRFAPHFSVDVGARYSDDRKRGREDQFQVYYDATVDPFNAYGAFNAGRDLKGDWNAFTGNVSLNYEPSADTLAYAKLSRGYKSGGFTLGALAARPEVESEYVTAYEVGLKQGFGPVQVNSAAFYYDYRDQQVPVSLQVAPGVVQPVLFNVPKSRAFGFETEATARPTDALSLTAVYSYLNATFEEFSGVVDPAAPALGAQDLNGADMPQSPRHRLTLNALYTVGSFDFSVSQSWVSEQYYQVFNTDSYRAPSFADTSLRATYTAPDERFRLIAGISNLFDETSYSYVSSTALSAGGLKSVSTRLPRIVSLEARVKF